MSAARIVVAVDASPPSRAAAETAAALASALGVELVGLFVEDLELLRLAELPAAVETDRLSGSVRPIARAELERQLRAQGERARSVVSRAVAGRTLRWSFRVARGRIATEILAAASEQDVVALGRVGFGGGKRIGSTARAVVGRRAGPVMLLPGQGARGAGEDRLRAELGARVEVFAPADDGDALARRLRELGGRLGAPVLLVR